MNGLEKVKKELEEALEKASKKLEEYGRKYWLLSDDGNIIYSVNLNDPIDNLRKEMGNYFKTEKEAKEYLEDLKIKTEIKKIAKELNGDKEIDWDDEYQEKYYLEYCYETANIGMDNTYTYRQEGVTYCLYFDFMDKCVERIGKERLKNYLTRN